MRLKVYVELMELNDFEVFISVFTYYQIIESAVTVYTIINYIVVFDRLVGSGSYIMYRLKKHSDQSSRRFVA